MSDTVPLADPGASTRRILLCALVVLLLATFWIMRWPWLSYNWPLNVDEAQVAASALKVPAAGFGVWHAIDMTTVGPLNAVVTAWPYLLGQIPTLQSTRLLGFFVEALSLLLLIIACARTFGLGATLLVYAPVALFLATTNDADYIHFASEKLPILVISATILVIAVSVQRTTLPLAFVGGLLAGSLPFFKLQSSILAIYLFLTLALLIVRNVQPRARSLAQLGGLAAGAAVPALCLLLPLALSHDVSAFWEGYVKLGADYAHPSLGGPFWLLLWVGLGRVLSIFLGVPALVAIPVSIIGTFRRPSLTSAATLFGGGLAVVALLTVWSPGNPFQHYVLFAAYLVPIAAVGLFSMLEESSATSRSARGLLRAARIVYPLISVTILGFAIPGWITTATAPPWLPERPRVFWDGPALLSWIPTSSDRALVWGWQPEIYVNSRMLSASRASHTSYMLEHLGTAFQRARLEDDWQADRPDILIDAVAGANRAYPFAESQGFPAVMKHLWDSEVSSWSRIGPVPDNAMCPRTYVSPSTARKLAQELIPIVSAQADKSHRAEYGPEQLADHSVYESCNDFWLLPDGETGTATLRFAPDRVGEIWILNTQDGQNDDRASGSVIVTAFSTGAAVWSSPLTALKPYPVWSVIRLPQPAVVADEVRLEVKSILGKSGGLNEVLLVRPQQPGD